jgi:hypothetical protein
VTTDTPAAIAHMSAPLAIGHGERGGLARLGDDAKAADAKVTDLDSFKAVFSNMGKNDCGSCHETYRVKKD